MVDFITLGVKSRRRSATASNGTTLARGAIGLREVLFQSVASMAPAGAAALSIAAGTTYAGGALPLAVLLALVFNLSCIMFYLRRRRQEFNLLLHLVIPVVGIAAFIPAFLTALGIGHSFLKFVTPLSYPSSEAGLAIGIWYLIGVVVLIYLYARHPARLPEMKRVFADEAEPAADQVAA
jgi:hypothetical protein